MTTTRTRHGVPLLDIAQRAEMRPELLDVIEYRKSGLSVNWIVGCPLDCGYCVRHLFDNFEMKVPRALMDDEQAADLLTGHRYFRPHVTPIQLLNRATDPMLPRVKQHTLNMLKLQVPARRARLPARPPRREARHPGRTVMTHAVIVDAVRTPSWKGKPGGQLSGVQPATLLSHMLRALVERNDATIIERL